MRTAPAKLGYACSRDRNLLGKKNMYRQGFQDSINSGTDISRFSNTFKRENTRPPWGV